jgi:hypothetical protein
MAPRNDKNVTGKQGNKPMASSGSSSNNPAAPTVDDKGKAPTPTASGGTGTGGLSGHVPAQPPIAVSKPSSFSMIDDTNPPDQPTGSNQVDDNEGIRIALPTQGSSFGDIQPRALGKPPSSGDSDQLRQPLDHDEMSNHSYFKPLPYGKGLRPFDDDEDGYSSYQHVDLSGRREGVAGTLHFPDK